MHFLHIRPIRRRLDLQKLFPLQDLSKQQLKYALKPLAPLVDVMQELTVFLLKFPVPTVTYSQ
ncbi:hypothetical protein BHG40_06460 [Aeromonas salmonicida subsp. masoucida]|nr:hypothetical protein BHG40_06460 [Aeromonas salmonicida subsp. masoucida]